MEKELYEALDRAGVKFKIIHGSFIHYLDTESEIKGRAIYRKWMFHQKPLSEERGQAQKELMEAAAPLVSLMRKRQAIAGSPWPDEGVYVNAERAVLIEEREFVGTPCLIKHGLISPDIASDNSGKE